MNILFFFPALSASLLAFQPILFAARESATSTPVSSSEVTVDAQVFVSRLNDENTQIFNQMSALDQQKAMSMTQMQDPTGKVLSPNEAVSKVASQD